MDHGGLLRFFLCGVFPGRQAISESKFSIIEIRRFNNVGDIIGRDGESLVCFEYNGNFDKNVGDYRLCNPVNFIIKNTQS